MRLLLEIATCDECCNSVTTAIRFTTNDWHTVQLCEDCISKFLSEILQYRYAEIYNPEGDTKSDG